MMFSESFKRRSSEGTQLYDFSINFLKISGINPDVRVKASHSVGSILQTIEKRFLKLTVLQGSEQNEIGKFEVFGEECSINRRLSCQFSHAKEDVLAKLHVYVDEEWSSGLTGHITVDLKEFLQENDAEVYLEYPLSASGQRHTSRTAKLEMTLLCLSQAVNEGHDTALYDGQSGPRPLVHQTWCLPTQSGTQSEAVEPKKLDGAIEQEIDLLKEMEGPQRTEDEQEAVTRPDLLAALFFAAGMSFQQQLQIRRIRYLLMQRGKEHSIAPAAFADALMQGNADYLPGLTNMAALYQEVQCPEVVTFSEISKRDERVQSREESSSDSCGPLRPISSSSDATTDASYSNIGIDIGEKGWYGTCTDCYLCSTCSYEDLGGVYPNLSSSMSHADPLISIPSCLSKKDLRNKARNMTHRKVQFAPKHQHSGIIGCILGVITFVGISIIGATSVPSHVTHRRPTAGHHWIKCRRDSKSQGSQQHSRLSLL